jgi:hypothetical protein
MGVYSQAAAVTSFVISIRTGPGLPLLPVWKYDYTYKGKEYPFYVNGQTGKLVGTAPISKAKVWAYAGTLGVTLAAILCMVNVIASLL